MAAGLFSQTADYFGLITLNTLKHREIRPNRSTKQKVSPHRNYGAISGYCFISGQKNTNNNPKSNNPTAIETTVPQLDDFDPYHPEELGQNLSKTAPPSPMTRTRKTKKPLIRHLPQNEAISESAASEPALNDRQMTEKEKENDAGLSGQISQHRQGNRVSCTVVTGRTLDVRQR